MNHAYAQRQTPLQNQLRLLWSQHVYWTRFFIISTAASLGDLEAVTNRLLQNPGDFAQLLTPFYGTNNAEYFKHLFTQHLLLAADLVNAAKNKDTAKAAAARQSWYENAAEISAFLADLNPFWSEETWREMMFRHLDLTEQEATLRLEGRYPEDINVFDSIEAEALQMADYMFLGISRQFL